MHKPRTYGGISDLLTQSHHAYRRALWDPNTNSHYCEVWIEKDALTGVFVGVTGEYDVPLMPCKGYPSLSFQRDAARRLSWAITDRLPENDFAPYPEAHVYYFGDFDPSGKDIPRNCEVRMREFLSELGGEEFFHFHQVAVNHEQIERWGANATDEEDRQPKRQVRAHHLSGTRRHQSRDAPADDEGLHHPSHRRPPTASPPGHRGAGTGSASADQHVHQAERRGGPSRAVIGLGPQDVSRVTSQR